MTAGKVAPPVRMWENESDFQQWIIDTFKFYGWLVKHAPVPMRAVGHGRFVPDARGKGLPDLLLMHSDPARVYWAEVKGIGGVTSDAQKEVLGMLRAVCDVVRDRFAPSPSPVKVFAFVPGHEDLIVDLARGARL